jgi:hypothetical protein
MFWNPSAEVPDIYAAKAGTLGVDLEIFGKELAVPLEISVKELVGLSPGTNIHEAHTV